MSKIIYLVPEDYGFISHRLELANKVSSIGHDVSVITRVRDHESDIVSNGFKLFKLRNSEENRNRRLLLTILDLLSIYRNQKPDLVHHFTIRMAILGTIAARLSGNIKVINTITGLGSAFIYHDFKYKVLQRIVSTVLRIVLPGTQIIVQNNSDYDFIKGLGLNGKNIHKVFGSGVDVDTFVPIEKDNQIPHVILPSRMLWVKGIGDFIEAIKLLRENKIECKCILIGESDDSNPASITKNQLLRWETEGWIEWQGYQKDMVSLLNKADIVCLPSYREGLPKTLLEAASSGIPIVTTDAPGCREVVDNGINGILVEPKNPEELYLALRKLIIDSELRSKMGINGRVKVVKELSSEVVINKTQSIYSNVLPNYFKEE